VYWLAQAAGALIAAAILRASLGNLAHVGATLPTGSQAQSFLLLGPALVGGDLHALWLYVVAPLVGAALGALAYQCVRGEHVRPGDVKTREPA